MDAFAEDFISIHTLRMERDARNAGNRAHRLIFQSTRSAWSVTISPRFLPCSLCISIHTLRMERDSGTCDLFSIDKNFNPHAPHGA